MVVRYSGRDKTVAVDEYYYHGDKYDGEITINITIYESIEVDGEGLKVKALGDGLFAYNANLKRVVIPGKCHLNRRLRACLLPIVVLDLHTRQRGNHRGVCLRSKRLLDHLLRSLLRNRGVGRELER